MDNLLRISRFGESAIQLELAHQQSLPTQLQNQQKICALAQACLESGDVIDCTPGMNNLTLFLKEPEQGDFWIARLAQLWSSQRNIALSNRQRDIPVKYGGEYGPDLAYVAQRHNMSEQEVIQRHSQANYWVLFLGFQPGFGYLSGLDPKLFTPRRNEPRLVVPAGSVGIGNQQTGIYPASSPGGWQLIGRTDISLFDANASSPSYLLPGDQVRFRPSIWDVDA